MADENGLERDAEMPGAVGLPGLKSKAVGVKEPEDDALSARLAALRNPN